MFKIIKLIHSGPKIMGRIKWKQFLSVYALRCID